MKYIVRYENFNESKGISDSSEKLTDKIWLDVKPNINTINYYDFDSSDFKLKNLEVKFNYTESKINTCNSISIMSSSIIENGFFKDVIIEMNISYLNIDEEFSYYIKSVLLHEISHIFVDYNVRINNKFRTSSFSIGSIIPKLREYMKTKYVKSK